MANVTKNTFCVYSTETWLPPSNGVGSATLVDNFVLNYIPH
jgi:hypothetical protein